MDGATAVVGAPPHPDEDRPGQAFVYDRGPHGWRLAATLQGEDENDAFGIDVAVGGDTIVVGAPDGDTPDAPFAGGVHVYERGLEGWTRTAVFAADDGTLGDRFGWSVALDGDTLVVGATEDEPHGLDWEGSAYIFERAAAGWLQLAKLVPDNPDELARFGYDVDIEGQRVVVGVIGHDEQAIAGGTAFIFETETENEGWDQVGQLWPSDPGPFHRFGSSVALDGDRVLLGAPGQNKFEFPGAAYLFEFSDTGIWDEVLRVEGDGDPENNFGESVDLGGERLVVGASGADEFDYPNPLPHLEEQGGLVGSGAVFVYEQRAGEWGQVAKLMPEDRGAVGPVPLDDGAAVGELGHDRFGFAVDLEGDRLIVGAFGDDTEAGDATGSAYLFTAGCPGIGVPGPVSPPGPSCLSPGGGLP